VTWQQLAPSNCGDAATPACRRSASAVYDRRRDRLVMVFGRDAERFFADSWSFEFEDRRWHASSPTEETFAVTVSGISGAGDRSCHLCTVARRKDAR
jgi:hypothetical protein